MNLKTNLFKKKKAVIKKDNFNKEQMIEMANNLPVIIHLFLNINKK